MENFAFYAICIAIGLNGWLAFPVAIDAQFNDLLQGAYQNPFVAPTRKLLLFGFSAAAMFCCVFAWFAPQMAVFFAWVAAILSAGLFLVVEFLEHGVRGMFHLGRPAYLSLALRFVAAGAITVLEPSIG